MDSNMGKPELEFSKLFSFVNNENRNKFCCILNNHDNFNTRTNIFNKLNSYKKVDSGGNWNKNIDYKIKQGEKYKNKWLSNYKFNICCEAIIENGYITEKILRKVVYDLFRTESNILAISITPFSRKVNFRHHTPKNGHFRKWFI